VEIFERILNITEEAGKKSIFLFGPRQTGKTFLLNRLFPGSPVYSLLKADEFLRISQRPQVIREEIAVNNESIGEKPVIIDEIQKLPMLLDEVHFMIESYGINFVLTGSSPRKLKRGSANLLGGRARTRHLFPLVSHEIPDFDIVRAF
jgi:predicted AAA+ superfamily ATPase